MSDNLRVTVRRTVHVGPPPVVAVYEVVLTPDVSALVSSELKYIEFHTRTGLEVLLTVEDARQVAGGILGAIAGNETTWVCARCGRPGPEHASGGSAQDCPYEPVLVGKTVTP